LHGDTFRFWTKKYYLQIGTLKSVQKLILQDMLPWRHVSAAVQAAIGACTAAGTCRCGIWLTDDLNPYSISRVMCSWPSMQTRTSWLQYISNVTPLIWLSIYHHITLSDTLTITVKLSPTLTLTNG